MSTDSDTNATGRTPAPPIAAPGFLPVRTPDLRRSRRRRRWIALLVTAMVLLFPVAVVVYGAHDLNSNITRLDGLLPPDTGRPPHASGPAAKAMNVMVLGDDAGSTGSPTDAARIASTSTGALMVVHIAADRGAVSVISIPPDSWVDVPGHGKGTIAMASAWGGPSLVVSTFEKLTGVRIDHVAVIGWDGYQAMIDTLGGVDVMVQTASEDGAPAVYPPGKRHMDGAEAVVYARQRGGGASGELASVARRQAVLRALSTRAADITSSPVAAYGLLQSLTKHLAVDSGWSATAMAKLALSLRGVGAGDVSYLTVPVARTSTVGGRTVVIVDRSADRSLWTAVRDDRVSDSAETGADGAAALDP
jgi:LCP family protein required for cell wall assembly